MQFKTQKESDQQLRESVLHQLEWAPQVTSTEIRVAAADQIVTLTGFVPTYAEKYAAEKAAQAVYGVHGLANDIEVKPVGAHTDPEIARDVVHAMNVDVTVPDNRIKVLVKEGVVTLDGTAEWDFQRRGAESCARNIAGVRSVVNHITVKPRVSAAQVSTRIDDALRRIAYLDARRITVSATDSTVDLYGSVHSWFERQAVERIAWASPGVANVRDHIVIAP